MTETPASGETSEVLFGQSYFLRFDPKLWDAMQPYPPLGTLFAASAVRAQGWDVALFDAMLAHGEEEWEAALDKHRPTYAVLFEDNFNYLSKMCLLRMREAAFTMLGAAQARGCVAIVCGSDATDHAAAYLDAGADYVIRGEGDATLMELLGRLRAAGVPGDGQDGPARVDDVAGLTFRREGELVRSADRPVIRDLDALPMPAWDLVDFDRYRAVWLERHGYFSVNMVTTRGCPFHCNWCAKPIWGQTYHMRSPGHVVEELRWLVDHARPDHIWFADDILGLKKGWLGKFADALEKEGLDIPFKCLSRVDLLLRDGEIESLARAGCRIVWVGAESGSQKVLDAMEKGSTVEQIREASRRLHEAGIEVGFFLQFGYPGETREEIESTLELVRDCEPDEIGMSVSYPLPGTPFYERVRDQLGSKQNWQDSADLDMLYQGPFETEFYRQLVKVTQKMFRARKGWRGFVAALRRPASLRPGHLRSLGSAGYHRLTLPAARRRLDRLAHRPDGAVPALDPVLSQQEAARPSPQEEAGA